MNFRETPSEPLIDLSNKYPSMPLGAQPKRPTKEPLEIPRVRYPSPSGLLVDIPVSHFGPPSTTLQPVITKESSPAMKWANKYDKDAIREAYGLKANHDRGRLVKPTIQSDSQMFGSDYDVSSHVDRHYKKPDPDYGWLSENKHPDHLRHDLPSLNATESSGTTRKVMDFFRRRGRERE